MSPFLRHKAFSVAFLFAAICLAIPGVAKPDSPKEFVNSIGMTMIRIPSGEVSIAKTVLVQGRVGQTREIVGIPEGLYFGKFEVTNGQFRKFVKETGYKTEAETDGLGAFRLNRKTARSEMLPDCSWNSPGWELADDLPVVNVSWKDAGEFCKWLSAKEKEKILSALKCRMGIRLPRGLRKRLLQRGRS